MLKYGRVTLEQFAKRFTDPFLRQAFPTLVYNWPQSPMLVLLSFLGRRAYRRFWHGRSVAQPTSPGRSSRRLRQLGGEISYEARVVSILTEGDRAIGVRLADGSEERADIVVSNAYGPTTIFDMLGGRYVNRAIKAYYDAPEDRVEMGIHVSLGVARDLSEEPHAIVLPLPTPVTDRR